MIPLIASLRGARQCAWINISPKMSVSEFMGYPKGKQALMIFDRCPEFLYMFSLNIVGRSVKRSADSGYNEINLETYYHHVYTMDAFGEGQQFCSLLL